MKEDKRGSVGERRMNKGTWLHGFDHGRGSICGEERSICGFRLKYTFLHTLQLVLHSVIEHGLSSSSLRRLTDVYLT